MSADNLMLTLTEDTQRLSLLQAVFDSSTTAQLIGNTNGEFIAVNDAFCNLLGYTKEELANINPNEIALPDEAKEKYLQQRFLKPETSAIGNFRKKSGVIFKGKFTIKLLNNEIAPGYTLMSLVDLTEAEQVNKQITEQNKLISNLLANSSDIIGVIDSSGKQLMMSNATLDIFGYSQDELIDRDFMDFVYEADLEHTRDIIAQVRQTMIVQDFRNRLVHKNGSLVDISWNIKYDPQSGNIFSTGRDITELTQIEETLLEVKGYLGAYIDHATDALFVHDESGQFIEVNQQACTGLGYTREEMLKMNILSIEQGVAAPAPVKIEEVNVGQSYTFEGRHLRKDGSSFPVEVQLGSFKIKNKVVYVGLARNISERKQNEERIRNSEAQYRLLIENMSVGILKQGPKAEIMIANQAALDMLGLTHEHLIGRTAFDPAWNIIHEDGTVFAAETLSVPLVIATQKPVKDLTMGVYRPSTKDRVWLMVNSAPEFDSTGKLSYVISSFQDITKQFYLNQSLRQSEEQQKLLNEELMHSAEELRASNEELEQFAYAASHDLQEPLRMVTSFLTLLEKKYETALDDTGKKYINFAVDGARRMKQLVADLLSFSRAGYKDQELQMVDLNVVVNETIAQHQREIESEGASISPGRLPVVNSFRTPLKQVFENLIGNALKYHQPGVPPVISISWRETPSHYHFSVKDNGIGISAEYFDKIFVIFQRLHTKEEYSGTGIGLALVKKIVERLGGKISVESQLGQGSTFNFSILKTPKKQKRRLN